MKHLRIDEIGYWSEIKLEIIRKYAQAYVKILSNQNSIRRYVYIDAFAGAGVHLSKFSGELIPGSPLNALYVNPQFSELHFIDLDGNKAENLRKLSEGRIKVQVHEGNCNELLLSSIFPRCLYEDYCRALCLLDPYGLHLDWSVIEAAGKMKSVEIFLNFPVMDMNMNVLWRDPDKVSNEQIARMDAFWGDHSWINTAYSTEQNLFGMPEKCDNDVIASAFQERLKSVAGFAFVPAPIPMRNIKGATVYYLFFASPNKTGSKIVSDIMKRYRNRGKV